MKKQFITILSTLLVASLVMLPQALADSCCPHERAKSYIQESDVDGYRLEYKLIDMKAKMDHAGHGHEMEMSASHHLMLYIKNGKGEAIEADKVGFLVSGPDGEDQKAMAMGMGGGYGADLNLTKKGEYTVKSKAVIGEQKLIDSFIHKIE
jgi:hypothetical protein